MSNMSYCRFENTTNDFEDCLVALQEADDLEEFIDELSETEKEYLSHLLDLVKQFNDLDPAIYSALQGA